MSGEFDIVKLTRDEESPSPVSETTAPVEPSELSMSEYESALLTLDKTPYTSPVDESVTATKAAVGNASDDDVAVVDVVVSTLDVADVALDGGMLDSELDEVELAEAVALGVEVGVELVLVDDDEVPVDDVVSLA